VFNTVVKFGRRGKIERMGGDYIEKKGKNGIGGKSKRVSILRPKQWRGSDGR